MHTHTTNAHSQRIINVRCTHKQKYSTKEYDAHAYTCTLCYCDGSLPSLLYEDNQITKVLMYGTHANKNTTTHELIHMHTHVPYSTRCYCSLMKRVLCNKDISKIKSTTIRCYSNQHPLMRM